MKSIMLSIQPKFYELIANGKKTVEVRKTKPKAETPFKCYIYCTKSNIDICPKKILRKADDADFQHIVNALAKSKSEEAAPYSQVLDEWLNGKEEPNG